MHARQAACLALLALPAAALFSIEAPRFAPEAGLELRKSIEWSTPLSFLELTSTMGGAPVPAEYLPDLDIEIEGRLQLVVGDNYEELGHGRPKKLVRTYEEIEQTAVDMVAINGEEVASGEKEGETPLSGKTVVFAWDADSAKYTRRFEDGEGTDELLEGLQADLDFLSWLPPEGIEKGESWMVEEDAVAALFEPGGKLGVTGLEDEMGEYAPVSFSAEVQARLAAPRNEGGLELAIIEIEGEGESVDERPTNLDFVPVADGDATETRTIKWQVEGQIAWDTAAGHAHSAELTFDIELYAKVVKDAGQPGADFDSTTVLFGEWVYRAQFERVE